MAPRWLAHWYEPQQGHDLNIPNLQITPYIGALYTGFLGELAFNNETFL